MEFLVKRVYGKYGKDYLHAWCAEWGTACMGTTKGAMRFTSQAGAERAAARAQRVCKGANGEVATGVVFRAEAIKAA
ncbi:hypothetical protein [Marinobacter sp.]|uniref:hypothetical protein n=1 Tax=Marinobacter sp. TaxID=50741 RepID=UPI003A90D6F0